ncbi:hypothetical protein [Hydrogenoanaerobacterium sp.]|nr:hypothetical protein [Hydrogenoanaerobacterium sp.]
MDKNSQNNQPEPNTLSYDGTPLHFDWFHVSGDLDDFIFYGEDDTYVSER